MKVKPRRPDGRKYRKGYGEPVDFDRDGHLQDRSLTAEEAREMITGLQRVLPSLLGTVPIGVEFVAKRGRVLGEVCRKRRCVRLMIDGQNVQTLLHELAHIVAPSWKDPRTGRWEYHGKRFKTACLILALFWTGIWGRKAQRPSRAASRRSKSLDGSAVLNFVTVLAGIDVLTQARQALGVKKGQ